MEVLELRKRIEKTLGLINDSKTISLKRRYFVQLSSLVSIYNGITKEKIQIAETNNQILMNPSFYQSFVSDVSRTRELLFGISDGILITRKEVGCEFRDIYYAKTYGRKYIKEILESFLASLGDRFYTLYKEALADGRLYLNMDFSGGYSTFDFQTKKVTVFGPRDQETVPFMLTIAHEFGHVFEYDYTKCSRKEKFTNKYNVSTEVFSMFLEVLLLDYLARIHFDSEETSKLHEKYYNDLIGFASEVNFGLSLATTLIGKDFILKIVDLDDASRCYDEFVKEYNLDYIKGDINFEDSVNYMYGALIATIYEYYYLQDPSFLKEIHAHFLDYYSYSTEEILERLPFVRQEIGGYHILRKKLEQIKANQI